MGENTKIAWCDHTFNCWIGCQKVSPGCQNCYAEKLAHFHGWVKEWGKDYKLTSESNWKKPIQWAKQAVKDGVTRRVFCASLADVFDTNVSMDWRKRLLTIIAATGYIGGIEWLILTKRPENIKNNFPSVWLDDPPKFIRIGITCENQEMVDKRMQLFFDSWQGKNFISVEPMLSHISLRQNWVDYLQGWYTETAIDRQGEPYPIQAPMKNIDWVICGCESGPGARPCDINWARDLRDQCAAAGVPFFLKQLVIDGKLVREPFLDGKQYLEFPK